MIAEPSRAGTRLRCLIVGYGYMGKIRANVVRQSSPLELVGICDPGWSDEKPHIESRWYAEHREAIDDAAPDIVFVCTPNLYSPRVTEFALDRGSHVFCEKPPGRHLVDLRDIIDAERRKPGLKVMFGFNHRYHPAVLEAKAIIDGGRMGRILWLRGVYGKSGGQDRDFEKSWRNDPEVSGGGILLDQGVHMLDLFRFLCGDFHEVRGVISTSYWNVPVEDNAFVLLRNGSGQVAQLHSSATLWKHTFRLDVGLEGGYLIAEGLLSKSGSYGRETLTIGRRSEATNQAALGNPREEIIYFDQDRSWDLQVQEFIYCIRQDTAVTTGSTYDALAVMRIIGEVYRQNGVRTPDGWWVADGELDRTESGSMAARRSQISEP